jgi:hypothetical protein
VYYSGEEANNYKWTHIRIQLYVINIVISIANNDHYVKSEHFYFPLFFYGKEKGVKRNRYPRAIKAPQRPRRSLLCPLAPLLPFGAGVILSSFNPAPKHDGACLKQINKLIQGSTPIPFSLPPY